MVSPQSLPLPARAPAVSPLLAVTFVLLVMGLLAADTGDEGGAGTPTAADTGGPVAAAPVADGPVADPAVGGAPAEAAVKVASVYEVQRGDTLSTIASIHRVPVADLAAANGLAPPYPLAIGQTLRIPAPDDGPVAPLPAAVADAEPIGPAIERWAEEYDLPPALLKAVTWRESRWQPGAVSHKGAIGVGQVLPATAAWVSDNVVGQRLDPWRVEENLHLSAAYLSWLIERTGGDQAAAVAAYHQGRTSVLQEGWYSLTTRYVRDVFDLRWRFEAAAQV